MGTFSSTVNEDYDDIGSKLKYKKKHDEKHATVVQIESFERRSLIDIRWRQAKKTVNRHQILNRQNMGKQFNYVTKLDIKYDHLECIDIPQMIKECKDKWFNQTLTQVNDSVVRLGIVEGEYHWHKHDNDDEFFFVLDGQMLIDLENNQTIELNPNQGVTISKGLMHRSRAPKKTVMLMVETSAIQPTGD